MLAAFCLLFSSHELFLKADNYFLDENSAAEIYLYNGTFDKSENAITRDRIIQPVILGPEYRFVPTTGDFYDKDHITYLKFKSGKTGTYVAGISTLPRAIELNGEEFTDYLEHEGLAGIIAERENKGISDQGAREKYSKHVKAILQVGDTRTDSYATQLGYPIEFIPLVNPFALKVGDEASFQLSYMGKPLINQTVHVSSRSGYSEWRRRGDFLKDRC